MAMRLSSKLSIDQVAVAGKRILIRVDFNVPIKDGKVTDTIRIDEALPTIRYALQQGAQSVVLMSHLGRPDGKKNKKYTLQPITAILQEKLGLPVTFVDDCVGPKVEEICKAPKKGSIILLENLRFYLEEEGKGKDANGKSVKATKEQVAAFRQSLSKLGDIYVNDAFGTAHRAHSSMVGVNLPIRCSGFLLRKELQAFSQVIEAPKRPFVAILGGAKIHDKIQLIMNLLDQVDEMIIGGGMAFTFKKVIDGINIGGSLFDAKGAEIVPKIMEKAKAKNVKIHLPVDFKVADKFDKDAQVRIVTEQQGIPDKWMGLDIGPKTIEAYVQCIWRAKTVVFNGPMGVFEFANFGAGTSALMYAIATCTQKNGLISIIGGGDTASAAKDFYMDKFMSHISTGGGASLELLEGKQLPGIVALSDKEIKAKL